MGEARRKRGENFCPLAGKRLSMLNYTVGTTKEEDQKLRKTAFFLAIIMLYSTVSFASFRFVQITDTHGGRHEPGNRAIAKLMEDLVQLDPKPAFVICTGDFVETGLAWEYEKYLPLLEPLQEANIPIYHVPGNHESRWAARLKKDYTDNLGPTYSHKQYQGHDFLLLDTSFVPESYGHIETEQLNWLDEKLAQIGPNRPIWVFSHHPLGYRSRFTDNDMEVVDRLLPTNFILGMFGHGHSYQRWQIEGREFFMCKAGDAGGYAIVDIDEEKAQISYKQVGQEPRFAFEVPIPGKKKEEISLSFTYPQKIQEGEAFQVSVIPSIQMDSMQVRIGQDSWQDLTDKESLWTGNILPKYPGAQTLWLRGRVGSEIYQELKTVEVLPQKTSLPHVLWTYKTNGSIFSSPQVDSDRVYVGSHDGSMYAFGKNTGEVMWRYSTGGSILSSPDVVGGAVYFASGDGYIYSLAAATGQKLWRWDSGEPSISSPSVAEDKVYIGGPTALYCLDAQNGKLLWQYPHEGLIKVRPAVHEGKVYFTAWSRYVTCLDAQTGEKIWEREIDPSFYYAPATGNPTVYAGQLIITTPKYIVMALDLATGQELWRTENVKAGYCSPTIWEGKVLLTTLDGGIVALDGKTGAKIWTSSAGEGIYDAKIATEGNLGITGTCRGSLVAFDCNTGKIEWKKKLSDSYIFSQPCISNGSVYVGIADDNFIAVKFK